MPLTLHWGHYPAALRQPRHAHDELHLSLVLRGGFREQLGSSSELGEPLSVVAKDPGTWHSDTFGPRGATLVRLAVPLRTVGDLAQRDLARGWGWYRHSDVVTPFLRIAARGLAGVTTLDEADADAVDLLAAITARPAATRGAPPRWLQVVVGRLHEESQRLSIATVAAEAQVHPVYLARCVRRWYGTSLRHLQTMRRLRRAAATLSDAPGTTSAIAHATGFADEPHLCRTFRAFTGLTPGAFRTLATRVAATRARATACGSEVHRSRSTVPG